MSILYKQSLNHYCSHKCGDIKEIFLTTGTRNLSNKAYLQPISLFIEYISLLRQTFQTFKCTYLCPKTIKKDGKMNKNRQFVLIQRRGMFKVFRILFDTNDDEHISKTKVLKQVWGVSLQPIIAVYLQCCRGVGHGGDWRETYSNDSQIEQVKHPS